MPYLAASSTTAIQPASESSQTSFSRYSQCSVNKPSVTENDGSSARPARTAYPLTYALCGLIGAKAQKSWLYLAGSWGSAVSYCVTISLRVASGCLPIGYQMASGWLRGGRNPVSSYTDG